MAVAACLVLAACGGSGGGADGGAAGSTVVSGVAATGAPMEGAVVHVFDASGSPVASSAVVGSDGRYEVRIPAGARAPKLFHADLADGEDHFAVADEAAILGGTVNITPLTSLIAARLSPTGLPQDLVMQFLGQAVVSTPLPTRADISARTQEVLGLIAPLRQVLDDTLDPLTGQFAVGGFGHDKLLDSLAVSFTPRSDTVANVEVALRTRRAADAPLPAVVFASDAPLGSLRVGDGLARADFAPDGTSARIAELVAKINACLALPVAARVDNPASLTAAGVQGICRAMYFYGNPASFLHSGTTIGSGAGGELLSPRRQRLDRPVYRYTRIGAAPGLDLVAFTVRWSDLDTGTSDLVTIYAREHAGRLTLHGNQYAYGMQVSPIVLRQTHLRADSGHMDNLRSGYLLLVPNLQRSGQPYFDRVEVVTPVGLGRYPARQTLTLRPTPADPQHLQMVGQFDFARTSAIVWMGGGWVNENLASSTPTASGQTAPHPIDLATGGEVWIDHTTPGWTDPRIEDLGQQSVWTFRYFRRDNTGEGATPDAVQHLVTVSRAPSVRELRRIPFAELTGGTVTRLRNMSMNPTAGPPLFWIGAPAGGPRSIHLEWTVPTGATAPARINGFGRTTNDPATSWPDRRAFGQSATASAQGSTTLLCDTPDETLRAMLCDGTNYSVNTIFTDFELWGRSLRLVEHSHSYVTYIPHTRPTATSPSQPLNRP